MKANIRLAAGLLTGGIALAIAAAPAATAASDPHLVCTTVSDGNTACETPGNAQLTSSPPDVPYPSLYPFLLGDGLVFHDGGGHGMR
ncbi:keratin associated protein [Mycolicibacterium rhodesiae JS60]|nr:keratin associated protein [Mycolicibacterium rhodesiae JS60]